MPNQNEVEYFHGKPKEESVPVKKILKHIEIELKFAIQQKQVKAKFPAENADI